MAESLAQSSIFSGSDPTQRLRLGIRVNTWTSGGGQVFSRELVNAITRQTSSPRVTLFVSGQTSCDDWPEDVEIVDLGPHGGAVRGRLRRARAMRAALAKHHVDVLLCPGTEIATAKDTLSIIWPLTVAPFESSHTRRVLGGDARFHRARWILLRQVMARTFARADAAVYSSKYALEVHQRFIRRARTMPSQVIYPAPSLQLREPATTTQLPTYAGGKERPFLFVSRLYPYKMVVEMIEGYAIASRTRSDLPDLLVVGGEIDEAYAQRIHRAIEQNQLHGRVRLLGERSAKDLAELYPLARAFIFPSLVENAGSYALIDAFAYGLPVISSSRSSMPEVCGRAAIYFDPTNPVELATRIGEFLDSPDLEQELAALSRERIDWFPDWDTIAAEFIQFADARLADSRNPSNILGGV